MNLLMILLIVLAIWVCAAICFFAWRLMPDVEEPRAPEVAAESRDQPPGEGIAGGSSTPDRRH